MSQNWFCSCPECKAVLRLTAEQLAQHRGWVRCGACEHAFVASDHRMIKTASGFLPGESVRVPDKSGPDRSSTEHPVPSPPSESPGKIASEKPAGNENGSEGPDYGVEGHPADSPNRRPDGHDDTVSPRETRNPFAENAGAADHRAGAERADLESGAGEAHRLLSDNDYAAEFDRAHYESFAGPGAPRDGPEERAGNPDREFPGPGESVKDPFSTSPPSSETSLGIDRSEVDQYIVDYSNPLVTFTWFLVVAGFVFLLGLQVKYFFVEKYAQNEHYRQYLEVFCKVAACDLPPQKNLYGFTLTHTKIDLHPTQPGAMRLTVKLVNEAEFEQPYPALQLTFTDRVGRVVGRRTFGPDLYLPEEAENRIGRGEYVTILFDLARPHEKAVGFVVDIVTEPVS
ncbi:MAG: zinc-ribbon and DUF3426 domain-containing protein [Gammaproteobacteria bacterium]|nr:zinc-ribbon and DUF3426 domain-containing protein [Gammaproteobacteria bacterium]